MELKSAYELAMDKLESKELIPKMTDPMSRGWDQPDRSEITVVDACTVSMSKRTFDALCEYSTSLPSGVYEGKMWKCCQTKADGTVWWLRWYGHSNVPGYCTVNDRKILIV